MRIDLTFRHASRRQQLYSARFDSPGATSGGETTFAVGFTVRDNAAAPGEAFHQAFSAGDRGVHTHDVWQLEILEGPPVNGAAFRMTAGTVTDAARTTAIQGRALWFMVSPLRPRLL